MPARYYIASSMKGDRQHLISAEDRARTGGRVPALCPTSLRKADVRVSHGFHPARWWRHRFEAELCDHCWRVSRRQRELV